MVSNATHFSFKLDKSMKDLVRSSVADLRNAIIISEYLNIIIMALKYFL